MLKAGIVLNVLLLLVAVLYLVAAISRGDRITDQWMLPLFSIVLLGGQADAARQRAQAKK